MQTRIVLKISIYARSARLGCQLSRDCGPQQHQFPYRSGSINGGIRAQWRGEKHDGESHAGIDSSLSGQGEISGAVVEGTVGAGGLCAAAIAN
jgi:hypothetical protein